MTLAIRGGVPFPALRALEHQHSGFEQTGVNPVKEFLVPVTLSYHPSSQGAVKSLELADEVVCYFFGLSFPEANL